MTQIEQIKAEIKRQLECLDGYLFGIERQDKVSSEQYMAIGSRHAAISILSFIDSLEKKQPSLPSNLDEVAKEYNRNYIPFDQCDRRDIIHAFKAGAEWMAGQGETRIIRANADLDPHGADYGIRYLHIRVEDDIPVGTKFIVQIRKKQ